MGTKHCVSTKTFEGVLFYGVLLSLVMFTTDDANERHFVTQGTGFFLHYEGASYFATARHVAESLVPPFALRVTTDRDGSVVLDILYSGWFMPEDRNVDIAIVVGVPAGVPAIAPSLLLTRNLCLPFISSGVHQERRPVRRYRCWHLLRFEAGIVIFGNGVHIDRQSVCGALPW